MTEEATEELVFLDDVTVKLIDTMGTDRSILQAARVSTIGENEYDGSDFAIFSGPTMEQDAKDHIAAIKKRDDGLINYLMRDRHGSPFEHASIKVYVKAPIFVFREWQRHRIASYNEMSGRYTKLPPEFYIPKPDRPLVQVGKPGAYTFIPGPPEDYEFLRDELEISHQQDWERYNRFIDRGIAKEVSRIVLPGAIYSQMYCTMNLRALMNFLSLRTKGKENSTFPSFPQHEISLGADKLEEIFAEKFPVVHEAWNRNGRVAP